MLMCIMRSDNLSDYQAGRWTFSDVDVVKKIRVVWHNLRSSEVQYFSTLREHVCKSCERSSFNL